MHGRPLHLLYWTLGVVSVLVSDCGGDSPSQSWHVGCYHGNLTSHRRLDGATVVPVDCGVICRQAGMPYAALDVDHACSCLPELPISNLLAPTNYCSTWCSRPSPLPCGGPGVYSVYLSNGPYLYNVSLRVLDDHLLAHQPMAVEVLIHYAGLPNITTGLLNGIEDGELQQVTLTVDYGPDHTEQRLTAENATVHDDDVFTYNKPGNYTIRVTASNSVSDVTTSVSVTVLLPVPAELQLGLVTSQMTSQTPSCVPQGATLREGSKTLAVFAGEPVLLEATVNAGYNLTFDWSLGDDVTEVADRPADRKCEERACLTSRMNHTYQEEGVYNLTVTAHNERGAASDSLAVIAVKRELRDFTVTLDDGQSSLVTPSDSVQIIVSMTTTDRQDTTLDVDFGDGDTQTYLLVAHEGRFLGRLRGASDQVALRADYGKGCLLSLTLDHIYSTQGEYDVVVRVHNNHSDLSATLDPRLVVQARLQGLLVHGPRTTFIGKEYTFYAVFTAPSPVGVTYNWEVVTPNNEVLHNDSTIIPTLNLTFPHRGMYTVRLFAENLINSENTSFIVSVYVPIQGLHVSLLHEGKQLVSTGTTLSFEASITSGTGVEFEWDFNDEDDDDDLTSIILADNVTSLANHTFMSPGTYIIEVTAYNTHHRRTKQLLHHIEVRVPIKTLKLTTDSPTLKGNPTKVTATVSGGGEHTNITLEHNGTILPGELTPMTDTTNDVTLTAIWSVVLGVGQTEVTVTAENVVSTVTRQTYVDVEPPVDKVTLITEMKAVLGEKVVFIVLQDNNVPNRADLVYTWTVEGHVITHSQVPVLEHVFTGVARNIEVGVKVNNKVDSEEKEQIFEISDKSEQSRLTQGANKESGYPINFTIINLPEDCVKLVLYMRREGSQKLVEIDLPTNHTATATLYYTFTAPDIYRLEVVGSPESFTVQGTVSVQQRLTGVRIEGPSAARIDDTSRDPVWRVVTRTGSHLLYDWSVDGQRVALTPESQLRWRFKSPGHHVITVNVTNSLGSDLVRHDVYAEHSVTWVHLTLRHALTGQPAFFNVTVHGGLPTSLHVIHGDGTSRVVMANDSDVRRSQGDGYVMYYLNHTYVNIGRYDVTVNASNHVTWEGVTRHLTVEEPITGLRLNASHGPIVTLGTTVTVSAWVDSGRNLTFDWLVTGSVQKEAEGSSVTLQMDTEGVYNVTVYVTYALYKPYVTASLPYVIHVIQPLSDVTLRTENDVRAAPLLVGRDGTSRADVMFTATAVRGSQVVFTFDFGDGFSKIVNGSRDSTDYVTASVSHTYTEEGVYDVRVHAVNPLNDVTAILSAFYVEVPPTGCQLKQSRNFVVPYGDVTVVNVTYTAGTDVMFDWNMGDQTEYKNQSGGVSHQYQRPGRYILVLKCYNHVDSKLDRNAIVLIVPILGVEVVVRGGNGHPNGKDVIFDVKLSPESLLPNTIQYSWDFGEHNEPAIDGTNPMTHNYPYVGRYAVHVKAINQVSQQTSAPVKVEIVELLGAISVTVAGQPLLGRVLLFDAYHWKGSNVTYFWDFGDNQTKTVYQPKVAHKFTKTGEYHVVVVASNLFGNQTASHLVFVVQSPCLAPEVTLLKGANVGERNVTRGQELKLETDVGINCSITSVANYTWTLQHAKTLTTVDMPGVAARVYHDPILFVPRHTLDYGRYYVKLKVEMQGTIVYATADTFFSVVPADLMPVISGGLQRFVQRTDDVIMDASASYDPDFPNAPNLTYNWTCYQLNQPEKNCSNTMPMSLSKRMVKIPGTAFLSEVNTFVFNLTISRGGRPPIYLTSQVLEMKSHGIIDMTLSCSECEDGLINSDQRLIVEAVHPGYREDRLEYSWGLYIVDSDSEGIPDFHEPSPCVNADGSSYPLISPNTTTAVPTTTTNATKPAAPGVTPKGNGTLTSTAATSGTPSSTSSVATTTTGSAAGPNSNLKPQPPPGGPPGSPLLFPIQEGSPQGGPISEGHSGRRSDSSGSGRHGGPDTTPPGSAASGGALHTEDSPTEGMGSRRGSGSGFPPGSGGRDPSESLGTPGRSSQNEAGRGSLGGDGSEANDQQQASRFSPHIVSMVRSRIRIRPENTTTGTNQRALVFKPGVLLQGRTYIIEGKVKNRVTGMEGTALTYVAVNQSPSQGQCLLSPESGTEMDTVFKVICSDWKDEHLPIRYEISYSLSGRDLIYQGLNHKTTFMLPAGDAGHNHTVLVNIAILDSFGARTTVCSLPVKVKVADQEVPADLEEQVLYGLVAQENSTLQTFVSKGDNRNARLHAHLIAHRLNRLHKSNDNKTSIRARIRTSMLHTLSELPMRDEYEVQQTTSAVAASTAVSTELDTESLEYASQILEKATHQMTRIADITKHVDSDIITVAIQGTANILAAASEAKVKDDKLGVTKPVVERTRWSIHNLTQTELNHTVLGETPRRRDTPTLQTFAGRFRTSEIPEIANTTFTLPSSLSAILHREVAGTGNKRTENGTSDCYEVHVVNYKRNPFLYGKGLLQQVDSQVASLTLFACGGPEVRVQNLPVNDQVVLAIPSTENEVLQTSNQFELHKHEMQVHKVHVSLDPTDHRSLHILIDLEPYSQGRLFPIALLLRPDAPPTPEQYQYKKVFPASEEKLNLFLPAHALNESTTYYLGVVDAHFNAARPRRGEILVRHYTIRMWRAQCVFWDEQTDSWSDRGCSIQPTSTFTSTDCRCKHLTAFGAYNSLVPNDLNFTLSVDDFFDLNENPVTFTLIICLLGVYIVLLVLCVMADNHDQRKGAIVHLVDNSVTQTHTYVITMETGMRRGAGTSAKVSLVLHGKEGMSETRELVSQSGQPLFERNSRDTFIITLPDSLGQIWKVQLWHNNAGASPNWYLSRVIVKDINTGQTYYFSCERWFAVEEEDGKVEREIMVLDHGLGFAKVLWAKGTQYLTDYHLWFSMLCRPAYSRFTRAQRLTCCLSLVTSYMAVNAAWYRQATREYRGEFGLVDLSWRAVAVGIITALLVLPANLLIVFLFRRSKIKKVCIEDPPEKKYYPLKRDSIISLDSTVRLLQPAVTPSIFDQSMLNWATLQDWAQRQWAKRYHQGDGGEEAVGPGQVKREYDTDQASSGFGDTSDLSPGNVTSQDVVTSHDMTSGRVMTPSDVISSKRQLSEDDRRLNEDCELRRQRELDKYVLESIRSRKPRRIFLPHGCRYVAWVLASIIILGCSAITVLYGLRFGKTKSIMWLQSLFFSFMQCVFITHPFVVLIISLYTAIKYRNDLSIFDHHDDGVIEQRTNAMHKAQQQPGNDVDEDLAIGIAARQRSRYLRLIRPPQEKQLIEARKQIMKEKKATSVLSESVGVVILLFLLFFVAYSKDINTPYRLNTVLKDLLTKSGTHPFSGVRTVQDWYRWSQTEMLDTLYWEKWYNGQHTNHEKGYVGNSAIVGTISMRQLRVKADRCHTADAYNIMTLCYHDYYYGNHDNRPYGDNNTWRFYESNVTRATGLTGRHAHYDGSGYQIILPNTRKDTLSLLSGLESGGWIDRHTRGVIIEFTLYSAPTNLFSSVSLLLEQSPGGGVVTQARVSSAALFRYTTSFDNFVLACELVVVVVTLYKLHCEVGELAWYKKAYFKNPWKATEATALLLLLAYIACFIYRFVLVYEAVELMRATYHEEFVDVSYIAYWDEILKSLLGFIVLLIIVQTLRLFRNRKVFAKFGGVYRKAGMELLYLALMMGVWVCAYTCLGYAVYGSLSYNFSRADSALTTVLGLLTGHNGLADLSDRVSSQLFLISFLIFVVGSLTAYIVAVLTFHYRIYRDEGLPSLTTSESLTYFWNKLLQATGFGPKPPPSDSDQDTMLPPEFRISEIEYQVDEMLFKMNALSHRHGLPEKPPMYFTDSDGTYGAYSPGEDGLSSGGSEVRTFDEDRFEIRLQKIEDNLMANEPHLAQLLKLDAIGANVLPQETENELRSALEFEIFRQLQMQRGGSAEVRSLPSDNGRVVIHRLSSLSGGSGGSRTSSSTGGASSSSGGSPPLTGPAPGGRPRSREPLCRTKTEMDVLSVRSKTSRDKLPRSSRDHRGSRQSLSVKDALVLQDITPMTSSPNDIPLRDMTSSAKETKLGGSTSVETRLLEDPVSTSSCSSGGAEVRHIVGQSQVKGQPSPNDLQNKGAKVKVKAGGAGGSAGVTAIGEKSGPGYEFLYTDTSSGSDHEGAAGARTSTSSKTRSLRKTKSRGKGKGRCRLTPLEGAMDELGIDNDGYTSGSGGEGKGKHKT